MMRIRNTADRFGLLSKLFHWTIAISIIFLIWLGWYMVDLSYYDKWYYKSLTWHKSLGILVCAFALLKIGWQFYSPVPHVKEQLKPWERIGSRVVRKILLAMMILLPLTGFLISTSDGKAVEVFDWFEIPALISKNTTVRDWAIEIHFYLSYGAAFLILGHGGAALKHQFWNRDDTLKRMIWG